MEFEQLAGLVPDLLSARYPDASVQKMDVPPPLEHWYFEKDGILTTAKAANPNMPFLWIRHGVAIEIPRSEALALKVATSNRDLMVGRAFMAYGDDLAYVAIDETVFGRSIDMGWEPSVQDLVDRLENSRSHARDLSEQIVREFGGRPFAVDEHLHLHF